MLQRKTPLRRNNFLRSAAPTSALKPRTSGLRRVCSRRQQERAEYSAAIEDYLSNHPVCQIWIARHGLDEAEVLASLGTGRFGAAYYRGERVPFANQVHHRNKRRLKRLVDERWFMSACQFEHDVVENHKNWARKVGLLLPMQADADGKWGDGNRALATPELIASLVGKPLQAPL